MMKALRWIGAEFRFLVREAWGLLTLAEQKPDDRENGVDLGGQGRLSWRTCHIYCALSEDQEAGCGS